MSVREFFFALRIDDQVEFSEMVHDVAASVLRQTGYPAAAAADLVALLQHEVAEAPAGRRTCDVQFRAHEGRLELLVSHDDGRTWRMSRPLP